MADTFFWNSQDPETHLPNPNVADVSVMECREAQMSREFMVIRRKKEAHLKRNVREARNVYESSIARICKIAGKA